ncbi:hypothetical protein JOD18_000215 [Gracilibacillus alcaliphilus]|nr:hypothetical protein [Gracilibacillus alcaliphilus]
MGGNKNRQEIEREYKKGARSTLCRPYVIPYYLTISLRALPGLNAGTLLAGISISSPV